MLEPSDALLAALPAARWLRWWLLLLPDAAPPLLPAPVASCTKWASIATTVLMQHHCKVCSDSSTARGASRWLLLRLLLLASLLLAC
jgi:hypothetical protein